MNQAEYRSTIESLISKSDKEAHTNDAQILIEKLDKAEVLLFDGQQEIQPVKWHQIIRIYKLAVTCIEILRIIWPYIKLIISIIKK